MAKKSIYPLVLSAFFLALALLLPFLTGQISQIGNMFCPMHFPVLLCGFFCGPWYGFVVGLLGPLLRFFIFGMPPLMPIGIPMCIELATYGLISGLLYKYLPKRKSSIYISLVTAMVAGRILWGIFKVILYGFGWSLFIAEAFTNAIPGIILQIAIIPIFVISLEKYVVKT